MGIFAKVMLGRGGMQAPLRIEHILAPGFVKADGNLMPVFAESA
jgi:hypothetical protein